MNDSEQIKNVVEELVALKDITNELKVEIELFKYFNSELRYKLPDFQSENKKTPIINGHS